MDWRTGVVAAVIAPMGFLLGLLSFRIKQRWCVACGATLACPERGCHGSGRAGAGS